MDIRTAFARVVANCGGWEEAARLCGNAERPMRKAWCEPDARNVPNAVDAQIVTDYAIRSRTPHCYAYVEAIAKNAGGRFVLDDHAAATADAGARQLPGHASDLMQECADVTRAVFQAMSDGVLSQNDRKSIRKELLELAEAMKRVDGDVDADERAQLQVIGGGRS